MKILVYAHRLEIGGSQVNTIELTAALRDNHGHEVVLFGTPGPMTKLAEQHGLRVLTCPDAHVHPSLERMRALARILRSEQPDLLHVWDWPQCLDAYYPAHLIMRIPMVMTIMSMTVPRVLPKTVPTTFGTRELFDQAKAAGHRLLEVIVPPVDTSLNQPDVVDTTQFRARCKTEPGDIVLVTVSRLEPEMKAESLHKTIQAVCVLGRTFPIRFILVGDGPCREDLQKAAREVNTRLRRDAVVLTGPLLDPRPAYASADIVIGMGGSALRGMAFAKPVIIVGERGFSAPFNPDTADFFHYKGIYGVGADGPSRSIEQSIADLVNSGRCSASLGEFSRKFVVRHYSLIEVSARLSAFCEAARIAPRSFSLATSDAIRTAAILGGRKLLPATLMQAVRSSVKGASA